MKLEEIKDTPGVDENDRQKEKRVGDSHDTFG